VESAILSVIPVEFLQELAAQALQEQKLAVPEIVAELVALTMRLGVLKRIKEPWRTVVAKFEKQVLTFAISEIVKVAEDKLIAAGLLPAPAPAPAA
jgi:hypothetical protein